MKFFHTIDSVISKGVNASMVGLFIVMMGLAVIQVFLRSFFHTSILWGDVAARHLVIWVGFLGAAMATRENKHFHIDVLTRFINPKLMRWFQSFANLFAAVVCYYLANASMTFIELEGENTVFLDIPSIAVAIIIPISFYVLMAQFAIRTVTSMTAGSKESSPVEQEAK